MITPLSGREGFTCIRETEAYSKQPTTDKDAGKIEPRETCLRRLQAEDDNTFEYSVEQQLQIPFPASLLYP